MIECIIPFVTLLLGYYLGKKDWKKQFILKHLELHEEILNKIENIFRDEIGNYYFLLPEREIKKQIKNHFVLSDSNYFEKLKKETFLPHEYFLPLYEPYDVKPLIEKMRKLISRSNKKRGLPSKLIIN